MPEQYSPEPETEDEITINEDAENPFVGRFESFFRAKYRRETERLIESYPEKRSLFVDFKELERYDYELADELLINPDYLLKAASIAVEALDIPALGLDQFRPHIRFFNLPEEKKVLLRDVSSKHLGKLIEIEGLVRMMTDVLPKLKTATWECRRCANKYKIIQSGQSIQQPGICECKHKDFNLVAEESEFIDYQKIQVQEPLELLKGSEQATNFDVFVSDDLVNRVTPGDRSTIVGILRLRAPKEKKVIYDRYLEVLHLEETAREFDDIEITKEEEEEITKLSKDPEVYNKIIRSIAPAIYGHENMKEAIMLQLFGGLKKTLPGNNTIRGDIHLLLVGEPGMAKSALLQAVDNIAPKSIYIAGKTATGAGISATAVKDEFGEGGWTLKAGALVLASGGICLVDELDKMDAQDRSALHESMEQQRISVAKAGIVTRFKSETSILAAANPKYSRFDPYQNFLEQIDLPATLMSRFDLFFMLKDVLDRTKDEEIASHILRTHQVGEELLQQKRSKKKFKKSKEAEEMLLTITPAIDIELLKKYFSYARQNIFPIMDNERITEISEFYVNLRDKGRREGSYAATHRQLEALVRLSEASARVRLSEKVEAQDTERALRLFKGSLQDLVTDQETGRIDIDIVTTKQTQTQRTQLTRILAMVKEKATELDMVPIQELIEDGKTEGIDADRVRELVSKLKKAGDIYEPRNGFVKPTQHK